MKNVLSYLNYMLWVKIIILQHVLVMMDHIADTARWLLENVLYIYES